jgi:hypothetical protein
MALTKQQIHNNLAILMESFAMEDAGKKEEAEAFRKAHIPLEPWAAKLMKKQIGVDWLRNSGYDLSLAEAKYGKDWLNR